MTMRVLAENESLKRKLEAIKDLIEHPTYHISTLKDTIRRILEEDQSMGGMSS